jgi:hypothetical protein
VAVPATEDDHAISVFYGAVTEAAFWRVAGVHFSPTFIGQVIDVYVVKPMRAIVPSEYDQILVMRDKSVICTDFRDFGLRLSVVNFHPSMILDVESKQVVKVLPILLGIPSEDIKSVLNPDSLRTGPSCWWRPGTFQMLPGVCFDLVFVYVVLSGVAVSTPKDIDCFSLTNCNVTSAWGV